MSSVAAPPEKRKFLDDIGSYRSSGIHAYNTESEQYEEAMLTQATALQNNIEESQSRIKDLFEALRVTEEQRGAWWDRCFGLIDEAGLSSESSF